MIGTVCRKPNAFGNGIFGNDFGSFRPVGFGGGDGKNRYVDRRSMVCFSRAFDTEDDSSSKSKVFSR